MKRIVMLLFAFGFLGLGGAFAEDYRNGIQWEEPALVKPGKTAGAAPSDAIVLFDGKNLDAWEGGAWDVKDGVLTVNPKTGDIRSKEKFGSCQVHLEFMTPPAESKGQGRGNSGLFLMAHYEVQILDSYNNPTYYDGMCGSIYKQSPPYVNACKKPGEWQTYDVIFTRPVVRKEGDKVVEIIRPAYITAILNGIVVQNHFAIQGETYWHKAPEYLVHEDKESIRLQDHNNRMKFRNIWVRNIPDSNDIQREKVLPFIFDPKTMKESFEKEEPAVQKQSTPEAPAKQK
ncbi:MAG: DUF1080 domain-containing protein [Planctomycetia bacterium]|nr:DUF1080 domain-containing protein [Planctomycetia bacterium]